MTPEQEKALALARARLKVKGAQPPDLLQAPTVANGPKARVDDLTRQAMAAYDAGDSEAGKALLVEASRASIDAGMAPQGMVADPATGGMTDIRMEQLPEGRLASLLVGSQQGLTFGGGDELQGGLSGLMGGDARFEMERFQEMERRAKADHPYAYYSGAIPGAVASSLSIGKALGIAPAASLPGMAAQGATIGGAEGAVSGFLSDNGGLQDRMVSGRVGGLIGAGAGAAIPLVGAGVQRGYRAASDAWRGANVGKAIGSELGVSRNAGRVIGDLMSPDDPAAMRAAMDRAGPDAMLADASPTASGMVDSYMRSPTPGARLAGERINERASGAGNEVIDALMGGMQGPRMPPIANMAAKGAAAKPIIHPLYKQAYDTAIDYSSPQGMAIEELMTRIPPKQVVKAVESATDRMIYDGFPNAQILAQIGPDGKATLSQLPNVMQLDYIKRAFDEVAEGSKDAITGKMTPDGAFASKVAKDLRGLVKEAVPVYGEALDAASTDIRTRAAVQTGQKLLKPETYVEDVLSAIDDATPAELRAMREGVMGQIDHAIGNVKAVGSDQNIDARQAMATFQAISSPNSQQKMQALFGDQWDGIKASLDHAGASLGLRARTAANSATNSRGVFQEATMDAVTPNAAFRGKALPAVGDAFATLMNSNPAALKRASRDVQSELADLLTRRGAGPRALNAIVAALAKNPVNTAAGKSTRAVIDALMFGNSSRATEPLRTRVKGSIQ